MRRWSSAGTLRSTLFDFGAILSIFHYFWEAFGIHFGVILSYFSLTFADVFLNSVLAVEKVDPERGKSTF